MPETLTFTTEVTVNVEDAVDALLENPDAITALFDRLDQMSLKGGHLEGLVRAASIEEIVMPLIWDAFAVQDDIDYARAVALLEQHLPETVKIEKRDRVVYDGHPKIRLALELIHHWCGWVSGSESKAFDLVYERLRERTTEWLFENWVPAGQRKAAR